METTRNLSTAEACLSCGKRKSKASLTAWMFSHSSCHCLFNSSVPAAGAFSSPRTIVCGRYRLVELIGQGGMGSVYRAYDEVLDKIVAIKMLRNEHVSDPLIKKRFEKEVRAAASLNHRNFVAVLNCGVTELGDPFLVMDYIEGRSLADVIEEENGLTADRAVVIFLQVLSALACAHNKGIIHRDVKPSNIILTKSGDTFDFVKLVDFGIAKTMKEQDLEDQSLTQTGEVFGSPLYMSPEQCLGRKLDSRSDLYSLGCVMYECLTGTPPFAGVNPIQTVFQKLHEEVKPFKSCSSGGAAPHGLEEIVMRALEREPENRYQTASDLASDLKVVLAGGQIPRHRRAKRKRNVSPMLTSVIASLLLFAALIVFGAAFLLSSSLTKNGESWLSTFDSKWQQLQLDGNQAFDGGDYKKALLSFRNAFELSHQAGRLDNAIASLNDAADVERACGHVLESDALIARAEDMQQKQLKHTTAVVCELNQMMDRLARSSGRRAGSLEVERLESRVNDMAAGLMESGHTEKALALLTRLDDLFSVRTAADSLAKRRTLHNLAYAHHCLGDYRAALGLYRTCLASGDPKTKEDETLEALTQLLLGRACIQAGEAPESQPLLERSLATFRRYSGPSSPEVAWVRYHLAGMYLAQNSQAAAEEEVRTALTIYEGTPNVDVLRKASCYVLLGKVSHEVDDFKTALSLNEAIVQKNYPSLVEALSGTACCYQNVDPERARNLFVRALSVANRLGPEDRTRCRSLAFYALGQLARSSGDYVRAEDYHQQALELRRQVYGRKSWEVFESLCSLGVLGLDTQQNDRAHQFFKGAFAIAGGLPERGRNRERILPFYDRYKKLLLLEGRGAEALAMKKALRV